jgi:3-oxoacyl-[acyl-carrier-protein] synthase II
MDEWDRYTSLNTRLAAPVDVVFPVWPRKKIRGMGRVAKLALLATQRALACAGIGENDPLLTSGRCGIAFGSSMGSMETLTDLVSLENGREDAFTSTTYIKAMPQTCAANIEVYYGLTGRLLTTCTACNAGSLAAGLCYETIKAGKQDVMIAGGADELSPGIVAVFDTLFATSIKNDSPELTPCPFDKDRDGLVVGEGAGVLIVEDYEHAKARGANIYAEIVGFGTNTDGTHITNPNRETQAIAMKLALEDAGIPPEAIGYVNMHGTGTSAGDNVETNAVHDVFGNKVPVSTQKSYTGHTLAACGSSEAWFTINMMREKWFAPNINLHNIDSACAPLDYIIDGGRTLDCEYALTNNFAFGGINTSLVLKRI